LASAQLAAVLSASTSAVGVFELVSTVNTGVGLLAGVFAAPLEQLQELPVPVCTQVQLLLLLAALELSVVAAGPGHTQRTITVALGG
jgi:uncharacterized membrane protein YhhN